MPKQGKIAQEMRKHFARLTAQHGEWELIPLYIDKGVYVMDVEIDASAVARRASSAADRDINAEDEVMEEEATQAKIPSAASGPGSAAASCSGADETLADIYARAKQTGFRRQAKP